jgi:RNA polymerase sigma factor (sigma-70 family)
LERVYLTYVQPTDAYARALVRSAGPRQASQRNAADLRQEIFLRAFTKKSREAYDPRREYWPYLKAIARNYFIDMLRHERREVLNPAEAAVWEETEVDSASDLANDPRLLSVVAEFLRDLPASTYAVYEERFVRDHSQQQASMALGLSRRRIRTLEERLQKGLRRELRERRALP